MLWSAAPHLWENYKQTIENLRKCVKQNGYIVIADVYLYTDEFKNIQPDYETLEETLKSVNEYNSIRVAISKLRDKVGKENIKTIRGLGYRLEKTL